MPYAQETRVPVSRSRAEIEAIVTRYGATTFASALAPDMAMVIFELKERRVRFELPLPKKVEFGTRVVRGNKVQATPEQIDAAWEQACRQRWRALALCIKAKLEAVDSGITTFEDEFLAHIILPGGELIGRWMKPQLEESFRTGKMPPLLPGVGET